MFVDVYVGLVAIGENIFTTDTMDNDVLFGRFPTLMR